MPERITVNGYDVEGGVVTYNISVGDTLTLTKRFRECVALSDALKKADPSVAALPNPLHHNLRSTEKLAKTRVESLQEFLAALPLASLASDDWATFLASPPSDDPASPDKGATLPDPDAPPVTPAGKAPERQNSPSFSEHNTSDDNGERAQARRFTEAGDPEASAAAVASALADAAVEEAPAAEAAPPPPAVAVASAADLASFAAEPPAGDGPAPPSGFGCWTVLAVVFAVLFAFTRSGFDPASLKPAALEPPAVEVVDVSDLPEASAAPVGDALAPAWSKKLYATYLEAPHKELKAAALAAATAGVALRGRQGA